MFSQDDVEKRGTREHDVISLKTADDHGEIKCNKSQLLGYDPNEFIRKYTDPRAYQALYPEEDAGAILKSARRTPTEASPSVSSGSQGARASTVRGRRQN